MKTVNDMLLIIDEPTKYLEEIYDIDSKKRIEATDFMY
jgi:hypothetical protein